MTVIVWRRVSTVSMSKPSGTLKGTYVNILVLDHGYTCVQIVNSESTWVYFHILSLKSDTLENY